LEKSISSRYYLDYNATSPLAKSVKSFLASGDFLFGNPASIHTTGKTAKKYINETVDFLFNHFKLSPVHFSIVFHSGATEGINTFFKGIALAQFKNKVKSTFFFSTVDHASAINLEEDLRVLGHDVYFFSVDKNGDFNRENLIEVIKKVTSIGMPAILNYTYVNNESGVVWSLEDAVKIKKETGAIIHVDAVQTIGKINNWSLLPSELDAYTFSGHKFGAMKSVGFSFINKSVKFSPLIVGGGQQAGLRAGTENALGIYCLKLALLDMVDEFKPDELLSAKTFIEDMLSTKGEIVGKNAKQRNLNTIFVIFNQSNSSDLTTRLDIQGFDVSKGSACSSGIVKENRILLNMGFSNKESLSAIRFSFSPSLNREEAQKIATCLQKALK